MAQGDFTKEEIAEVRISIDEMFCALSRPNKCAFLGHMNDVLLFLSAAEKHAPNAPLSPNPSTED